jgi:Cof subfamily protein (haloacid dehalogenase superfamily)
MSSYSDWLIVSDIDGTLNDKRMQLPPQNKESISRFVNNGGVFTLCSGRNLESLMVHYRKLNINTPAIFLNGAGIYDFKSDKVLFYDPITPEGESIIKKIYSSNFGLQLTVFSADKIYLTGKRCLYGLAISVLDKLTYERCKGTTSLPQGNWGKVSLCGLPSKLKKIQKVIKEEYSELLDCFFTSRFTLEIVRCGVNKGEAVLKLTNILGVDSSNVGAIGDYYNDLSMLKVVSHPACCGQSPEDIKSICEYITCHCDDGAVDDFIKYIENNFIL